MMDSNKRHTETNSPNAISLDLSVPIFPGFTDALNSSYLDGESIESNLLVWLSLYNQDLCEKYGVPRDEELFPEGFLEELVDKVPDWESLQASISDWFAKEYVEIVKDTFPGLVIDCDEHSLLISHITEWSSAWDLSIGIQVDGDKLETLSEDLPRLDESEIINNTLLSSFEGNEDSLKYKMYESFENDFDFTIYFQRSVLEMMLRKYFKPEVEKRYPTKKRIKL